MKLIRWLLSNIILIIIVLALSYTYVYWDDPLGEETPAGKAVAWLSNEVEGFDAVLAYFKVGNDKLVAADSAASSSLMPTQAERNETIAPTQEPVQQAGAEAAQEPEAVAATGSLFFKPQPTAAPDNSQNTASADRYVTPEIEQSLNRLPDKPVPPVASQQPETRAEPELQVDKMSTRDLWIYARQMYLRRDYEKCVSSYQKLIDRDKDNFDAYGELGNVFFNQGKIGEAAGSYFEAAAIMVRKGQIDRASSLLGLMDRMDESKAQELRELINSARS